MTYIPGFGPATGDLQRARGKENAPRRRSQGTGAPGARWQIIERLAAVVGGLLAPLLLVELLFRFVGPVAPGEYQTARLVMASEVFGRQNMANRSGWKRTDEYRVHVRVNSQGLRGDEVAYAKPPGVFRVLVVGDSFTFAAQVDEDHTLSALLKHELQALADGNGDAPYEIETINAGVDGWTTANELAWLNSEGLRYEPDLVVLMFFTGNDPGENYDLLKAVKRVGVEMDPTFGMPGRNLRRWLADHSTMYAYLETGIIPRLLPAPHPDDLAHLPESTELHLRRSTDPDRHEQGWQLSGDVLRQMRALTDEQRIGLLVVGIPTVEHVVNADRPPTPFLSITDAARAPALDLLMPFRSAPTDVRDALYYPKDRHWTPIGHAEATRHVAVEVVRRGFLHAPASTR